MIRAKVVYQETREANTESTICSLYVRAIAIRAPDLLLHERDRWHLIIEMSGRWHMTSRAPDAILDEEGNPIASSHEETVLLRAPNMLAAPRLAVEKALQWFDEGPSFLELKARESHAAGHTVHMERSEARRFGLFHGTASP